MKTNLYIELGGKQTEFKQIVDTAKEIWKSEGRKIKEMTSLDVYYKPDEQKCYYVINNTIKGSFLL